MLKIDDLSISIKGKDVLKNIDMNFEVGQNYCILGPNGSGKSSLALAIMGHPDYLVKNGKLILEGGETSIDISTTKANQRAKYGIFLAFQSIPEIPGLKVFEFLRVIYAEKTGKSISFLQFKKVIIPMMEELRMNTDFLRRDLNVGFSGGERRKLEVLQIKLLEPKYIILDEIDSGLDVDAFKSVANLLKTVDNENNCFIIITHLFTILEYISVNKVWIMKNGSIVDEGGENLAMNIKENGFS